MWTLALGTGLAVLSYEGIIGLLTSGELGHWAAAANRKHRPGHRFTSPPGPAPAVQYVIVLVTLIDTLQSGYCCSLLSTTQLITTANAGDCTHQNVKNIAHCPLCSVEVLVGAVTGDDWYVVCPPLPRPAAGLL